MSFSNVGLMLPEDPLQIYIRFQNLIVELYLLLWRRSKFFNSALTVTYCRVMNSELVV